MVERRMTTCGCGGANDIMIMPSKYGEDGSTGDGSPFAAKFAQGRRMLAASGSWSGFIRY